MNTEFTKALENERDRILESIDFQKQRLNAIAILLEQSPPIDIEQSPEQLDIELVRKSGKTVRQYSLSKLPIQKEDIRIGSPTMENSGDSYPKDSELGVKIRHFLDKGLEVSAHSVAEEISKQDNVSIQSVRVQIANYLKLMADEKLISCRKEKRKSGGGYTHIYQTFRA